MAPVFDSISIYSLFFAFLAAAGGSLHCVAMCGPLRMLSGHRPASRFFYQGGRAAGYLFLGSLAGYFGAAVPDWILLPLLLLGISAVFAPAIKLPAWQKLRQWILRISSTHPLLMGVSSALLPCGLLHAWLGVAALTQKPLSGALLLFVLWLGTWPALELSSKLFWFPLKRWQEKSPRIVVALLLFMALVPMVWRYSYIHKIKAVDSNNSETEATCPMHKTK